MTHHALIIEDDPAIINHVADVMSSLKHKFDTACSQEEALARLDERDYSYILLDIQIPARAQNGVARVQNTENLLEQISERGKVVPPIIILSDYVVDNLEQTIDVMRWAISLAHKGAVDLIAKPFPTAGRTLDRVIKKVLGIRDRSPKSSQPIQVPVSPLPVDKKAPTDQPAGQYVAADDGTAVSTTGVWLTVTQAAKLLVHDVPFLNVTKARARISAAAGRKDFTFTGDRKDRRIEPGSFADWRIKQRDRGLDEEDDE